MGVRRFMVHLHNTGYSPKNAAELLRRARSLVGRNGLVVRDARVSNKYVEYDMSIPDEVSEMQVFNELRSISAVAAYEQVVERHLPKEQAIRLAVKSFNDEKYWNAHEILEGVWKQASGNERKVLNGIILAAAAFVHDEKDEQEICISILKRALAKLEGSRGSYHGIDIDRLAGKLAETVDSGRIERFTI